MKFALAQDHRIGMRESNQDYIGQGETEGALLLTVADGMGGHFGGELAAEIAVGSLLQSFFSEARPTLDEPGAFLVRAIGSAHTAIRCYAQVRSLPESPQAVIVVCVVQNGQVWWNHVGDSRLYLVREGRVEARTRDHSLVQALVDAGSIDEASAGSDPRQNRVLQSLGSTVEPSPGPSSSARLARNDIVLLCSDGFWGPLRQNQLLEGLARQSLQRAIGALSDFAERRAGRHADNLAVLAMQWDEDAVESAEGATGSPQRRTPPGSLSGRTRLSEGIVDPMQRCALASFQFASPL